MTEQILHLSELAENLDEIKTAIAVGKAEEKRLLAELKSAFNVSSVEMALEESEKIDSKITKLVKKRDKLIKSANDLIHPIFEAMNEAT